MSVFLIGSNNKNSPLVARGPGKQSQQFAFSPFGHRKTSGQGSAFVPGFNGERLDPVSQSYHLGNGYRSYNPVLKRFNCPDSWSPFGAGGVNPYAYCLGDPINRSDPSGHISTSGIIGIVMGVVGIVLALPTLGASIGASTVAATAVYAGLVALDIASSVTGFTAIALEEQDPGTSATLGWVSMGLGIAGMVGLGGLGGGAVRQAIKNRRHTPRLSTTVRENAIVEAVNLQTSSQSISSSVFAERLIGYHGTTKNSAKQLISKQQFYGYITDDFNSAKYYSNIRDGNGDVLGIFTHHSTKGNYLFSKPKLNGKGIFESIISRSSNSAGRLIIRRVDSSARKASFSFVKENIQNHEDLISQLDPKLVKEYNDLFNN